LKVCKLFLKSGVTLALVRKAAKAFGKVEESPIDSYIAAQPAEIHGDLKAIRDLIRKLAPGAIEKIGYGIAEFNVNGPLVYFAAFKHHIGFYPTSSGIANFQKELVPYKSSRGAVQFPIGKPIPFAVIEKIVRFRLKENQRK